MCCWDGGAGSVVGPYVVRQAAVGQGENGLVMAFILVAFALVVDPGDVVGAQGGEGGQEYGALEPLVAAVGDVLAPYGGA